MYRLLVRRDVERVGVGDDFENGGEIPDDIEVGRGIRGVDSDFEPGKSDFLGLYEIVLKLLVDRADELFNISGYKVVLDGAATKLSDEFIIDLVADPGAQELIPFFPGVAPLRLRVAFFNDSLIGVVRTGVVVFL